MYPILRHLDEKTAAEFVQAIASIPADVTTLVLSCNRLYSKTGAELAQAFAAIPAGVTTLDLSDNGFGGLFPI